MNSNHINCNKRRAITLLVVLVGVLCWCIHDDGWPEGVVSYFMTLAYVFFILGIYFLTFGAWIERGRKLDLQTNKRKASKKVVEYTYNLGEGHKVITDQKLTDEDVAELNGIMSEMMAALKEVHERIERRQNEKTDS